MKRPSDDPERPPVGPGSGAVRSRDEAPIPRVPISEYRSWRSWFRRRYRLECEACGYLVDGFTTGLYAWLSAEKHRNWHIWARQISRIWSQM